MVLTAAGRMFIWGRGSYGRLGLGAEKDWYQPVECQLPGGHARWRVLAVAAGGRHSMCLALPVSHSLSAWKEQDVEQGEEAGSSDEGGQEPGEGGVRGNGGSGGVVTYGSEQSGVAGGSEQSSEELTYEQRLAAAAAGGPEVQEVHAMADEVRASSAGMGRGMGAATLSVVGQGGQTLQVDHAAGLPCWKVVVRAHV